MFDIPTRVTLNVVKSLHAQYTESGDLLVGIHQRKIVQLHKLVDEIELEPTAINKQKRFVFTLLRSQVTHILDAINAGATDDAALASDTFENVYKLELNKMVNDIDGVRTNFVQHAPINAITRLLETYTPELSSVYDVPGSPASPKIYFENLVSTVRTVYQAVLATP